MRGNGKVFISHAHDDNDRCRPLLDALDHWGINYWFDTKRLLPGDSLTAEIERAITERDVFLRICTVSAKRSWWVKLETDAFRALQARDHAQWSKTPRLLVSIILDTDYPLDAFELTQLYIEAAQRPEALWIEDVRRALDLPLPDVAIPAAPKPDLLAQRIVQAIPVALAIFNGPKYTVTLANAMFRLFLGLDEASPFEGHPIAEVLPASATRLVGAVGLDTAFKAGESLTAIELPVLSSGGHMTYWNVMTAPMRSPSSHIEGVLVTAVEVTSGVIARQRALDSAEEAQVRIGQMMTLHATSLAVSGQLGADPRELLADILRRSVLLLNGRAGTVYVRDTRRNELEVIIQQGLRGDYAGQRIRVGEGIAGQVARTGQGTIVDDYRVYPYRAAIYDNEKFSAVIAVPLIAHGQIVGVLDVLDDAERRAFTDDDLWLLDLFAAQASQTIENARTYAELEDAFHKQRDLIKQYQTEHTNDESG